MRRTTGCWDKLRKPGYCVCTSMCAGVHASVCLRVPSRLTPRRARPYRYFNCSSPGVQACSLPASCCVHPGEDGVSVNDQCGSGALRLDEDAARRVVHLEGCGPPLRRWLRRNVRAAGAYAIVVVAVQGVELLLANQLVRALAVHPGEVDSPRAAGTVALSTRASHSVKRPLPNWPRADSPGGPPGKVSYGIPDALASSTGRASGPPGAPFP